MNNNYICPKCQNQSYETQKIHVTGGTLQKFLDVQDKAYHGISCSNCGYTEFFKAKSSTLSNIVDLFLGG